jgi:branched-chain amino acid transport system permease protein
MLQRLRRRVSGTTVFMWLIGLGILAVVLYGAVKTLILSPYTLTQWTDLLIFGISQGGIYALIALGYTLVYGILRMINFAHSEVFMAGPFIGYFVATAMWNSGLLQGPYWVLGELIILVVCMVVSMAVAVLLERIAYRPLRRAPRLVPLITAIGASYFLQYAFLGLFGSNLKGYPDVKGLQGTVSIFGIEILKTQLITIVAALLFLLALYIFVRRTKTGKAMQAVSEDKDTAALMGINVDRIIVITFLVGGALAGVAGFFYAMLFRQVKFDMGFFPGIKAFTAAVLGGIGNPVGAMLGGMFLGISESLFPSLVLQGLGIPAPYQLKDALAFILLVFILIFRPTGILGERLAAKKA